MDLAKKLGEEARKTGCGEAELRWGPERKSYSGGGLVSGLGRGEGPETIQKRGKWIMALVREGVRKQSRRKKLKGIVPGWNRDRKPCMCPSVLQPPELE